MWPGHRQSNTFFKKIEGALLAVRRRAPSIFLVGSLGIAVDKGRLMDGEPTEITQIHDEPMEELMEQLGNILRRSPQIGVEITRMITTLPEGVRETATKYLPSSGGVDGNG